VKRPWLLASPKVCLSDEGDAAGDVYVTTTAFLVLTSTRPN